MVLWIAPPRFYAVGNIIVLYVGQDQTVSQALDRALGGPFAGAGIAQPSDDLPVFDPAIATVADLARRLETFGLEVAQTEEGVQLDFLTPVGQVIRIDGEELLVFTYDSVEQLKAEAVAVPEIQTFAAAPPTRYFAAANFIAVYTGENLSILTALDGVFGGPLAGPAVELEPVPFAGPELEPVPIAPGEPHPVPAPTGTDGQIFELQNPAIVVASTASDLRQLVSLIQDPELGDRLDAIDIEESVVIAVFRGELPTAGYGIEIEDVRTFEEYVEVTVSFTNPGIDELAAQVLTYPVAVHILSRAELPDPTAVDWIAVSPEGEVLAKFRGDASGSAVGGAAGTDVPVDVISVDPAADSGSDLSDPRDEGPAPPITLKDADIRGTISTFEANGAASAQILVEGQIESDTDFDKALVRITEETRIVRISANDAYTEATREELMPGTKVQVLFTGIIAESYPVQVAALHVVILD